MNAIGLRVLHVLFFAASLSATLFMPIEALCEAGTSEGCFRQVAADRPNVVSFEKQQAKLLKFAIYSSYNGTPAIDELLVSCESNALSENLATVDLKNIRASSCISGYEIHRVENLIDGKFGNDHSWVAADSASRDAPQWIELEWNQQKEVDQVVFSRDRDGRYSDRIPLDVEVFISPDGVVWKSVARIRGTINDVATGGVVSYGDASIVNAPVGANRPFGLVSEDLTIGSNLTDYDRKLQNAYLAEENAILKVAGFADCEPWLLQRHYPEFVEPKRKPENVLPLPTLSEDVLRSEKTIISSGTEVAFDPAPFAVGPLVEQTARAAIVDDCLRLFISGNRFISENIAMISTENLPTRAFIVLRDGKLLWKQIDPLDSRDAGSEVELVGRFDSNKCEIDVVVPLEFLPEVRERGFYLGLCIGARRVAPGGRPIHFKPFDLGIQIAKKPGATGLFKLTASSYRTAKEIRLDSVLGDIILAPGETKTLDVDGVFGQAGAEIVWEGTDEENGNVFRLIGFQYDPCYRPLCQLKDLLERAESDSNDALDERDFQKRVAIPGVVNPRYVDSSAIVERLNLPNEREDLDRFFSETERRLDEDNDPAKSRAYKLWKRWNELRSGRMDVESAEDRVVGFLAERTLFWDIRNLKRDFFLTNEDLEPLQEILANQRRPFWPSHNYSDLFDSSWNPGGAVVLISLPFENGKLFPERASVRELVQAGEGVIRNPSQSFDASKIYYAYRANQNEYFRIYELNLETGVKRRISAPGPFHDFWPTELPDGGLAFVSTRCKKKFICWRPQAFVLYRMNREGGDIKPLSFANLSEFAPSVCDDGRIMWTRSEYVDKGADYGHTLWTIRTDGTSPELTFGNTINLPQGYANGRRVPDSDEVSCVMISHFGDLNGPVALLDLSKGPHDPSAIRSITPEVPWPGYWARSETFREPYPISRDVFIVAHAPLDRFGLFLVDRFGNRELLTLDEQIDTICPQPFGPRDIPQTTSGSIDSDLKERGLGRFSIANVYRGLEGQVKKGAAKYLRVCEEQPTPLKQLEDGSYQADHEPFMEYYASPVDVLQGAYGWTSYVAKGVLGTAEIEEDGSAEFYVPSGKVLFFELLDENYNEIQRMRSVVQLQPGEQRSCVGCHESRLSAPVGGLTIASERKAQELIPPPWGAGPFWYERVVQPVLDRHCVECHNTDAAALAPRMIDLTGTRDENKIPNSYKSLIQSGAVHYFDYTWGGGKTTKAEPYSFGVAKSQLWSILKEEQHSDVNLSAEEEQALKCWIDLNVPLWGDYQIRRERE